jgi:hypothetical protein
MPTLPGQQRPYSFTFTAASLRPELLAVVAEQFLKSGSWDLAKAEILGKNSLQCRSAASLNRLERELRPRLQTLTPPQIELVCHATVESRTYLGWLAAVKHSAFLFDFSSETLRSKLEQHETILRLSDYRRFVEEKSSQHPELASLSETTTGKVQRVVLRMLREVGILGKGPDLGTLHRPVMPSDVERTIREDDPYWLAAFLVPDKEI